MMSWVAWEKMEEKKREGASKVCSAGRKAWWDWVAWGLAWLICFTRDEKENGPLWKRKAEVPVTGTGTEGTDDLLQKVGDPPPDPPPVAGTGTESRYDLGHLRIGIKMKITSVKINLIPNEGCLKAYASIIIDDEFVLHDLKVIQTEEKRFVAMPSKKHKGTFRDIAHPLNRETRNLIQKAVFEEYDYVLSLVNSSESSGSSD